MLRRHHCRRCGNVFCDACSSARMPLVNSGFFTPVRVCGKCSVAAKKAHAKMVHKELGASNLSDVIVTLHIEKLQGETQTDNGRPSRTLPRN